MRELIAQMGKIQAGAQHLLDDSASAILDIDRVVVGTMRGSDLPTDNFGFPLAGSLLPWIDTQLDNGQSREEWKAQAESNTLLGRENNPVPLDGTCVRIGAMRSHSQAISMKLKKNVPMDELEDIIASANDWVKVVPNEREATMQELTPT